MNKKFIYDLTFLILAAIGLGLLGAPIWTSIIIWLIWVYEQSR